LHDWKPLVEDLAQRRERAYGMGGPERIERQRSMQKFPVRERVDELLDPGTFVEYGLLADHMDPGLVAAGYDHLAADGMVAATWSKRRPARTSPRRRWAARRSTTRSAASPTSRWPTTTSVSRPCAATCRSSPATTRRRRPSERRATPSTAASRSSTTSCPPHPGAPTTCARLYTPV